MIIPKKLIGCVVAMCLLSLVQSKENEKIGTWLYKGPPKITFSIIQESEKYFLISDFGEGVTDREKVILKDLGNEIQITFDPPNRHGEYFVLNASKDLEVKNQDGIIEIALKITQETLTRPNEDTSASGMGRDLEWATPEIEGYSEVLEKDFPNYFRAVNSRPSIRLVAAYLPTNDDGKPDFGVYEKSGKQIIISRFPMAISEEQFPQLKEQIVASTDYFQKGKSIDLGGIFAKIEDFVPPKEGDGTSFATGMVFSFKGPDGKPLHQASVTMHLWIGGTVFRIEHQEFIDSLDDWYSELNKRTIDVRDLFVTENVPKSNAKPQR